MWRRTYFLLVLLRLFIALSPTYLHPDENFQGPEVLAGRVFPYSVHQTWEFTSDRPIRSMFALGPVYGLPMTILHWLWEGSGHGLVPPATVFYTLRAIMFALSFVLEDWAVHELVESPADRRYAVLLVASSYVTWTWQTHTFSNAIETIVVLWSLVLIRRITRDQGRKAGLLAPCVLALFIVYGTFNRVTFPAYILVPATQLLAVFQTRPALMMLLVVSGFFFTILAIFVDTVFYHPNTTSVAHLITHPVITPLNSLLYNSDAKNLALHGSHPLYQHLMVNLPQLLGPAFLLAFVASRKTIKLASAASGVFILSLFPHQEARFLLPSVPLILSSINLPKRWSKLFVGAWIVFNVIFGILMGFYHQTGVMPASMWLGTQDDIAQAFWWKTYSPPRWLLNGRNDIMQTVDLMGRAKDELAPSLCAEPVPASGRRVLVAPESAVWLDQFKGLDPTPAREQMTLSAIWSYRRHIHLDDMEFGDDGVWPTLARVVGRRGLSIWEVQCPAFS